jgi:two-component system sensor histidine kinase GlrK
MMLSLRPRSIFGVVAAGYVLIALPVAIVAVVAAAYSKLLLEDSVRLLDGGIRVIQQSQALEEGLFGIERIARQYQVLGDAQLSSVLDARRQEVSSALERLRASPRYGNSDWQLDRIQSAVDDLFATLQPEDARSPFLALSLERFAPIHVLARDVTMQTRSFIEREAKAIEHRAANYRRLVFIFSAVLLPASAVMALLLALYVVRPLRSVDRCIRDLGAERLDRPIAIEGPHELRVLGKQLDWLRKRLRSVGQDKARFLREMAHELKTPLTSVREGSELLSEGVLGILTPRQQEVAAILSTNSFEMQLLIENLLDYEAWRDKAGRLDHSWFSFLLLAQRCIRRYRVVLGARGIKVVLHCEDFQVYADRERLRLALDNLISNAVKFSPENGTITIGARLERQSGESAGHSKSLNIEIADEGPGIPPAERERIFEAFYKGRPPSGRHLEGHGVGLALVYDCVSAHGGDIRLVDGESSGAHFRVRIPQAKAAPPATVA